MTLAAATPVLTPTWAFCIVLAILTIVGATTGAIYLKRLYKTGRAAGTWTSFLTGPGAIQAASLQLGMLLAALGALSGPMGETGPSEAAVYRWRTTAAVQPRFTTGYIDASRYTYVTVATRVAQPENGGALVILYGLDETGRAGAVRRIAAKADEWSVWHSRNTSKQLRIGVDKPPDGAAAATDVEIELILAVAPPQELEDAAMPSTTTR